MTRGMWMRHTLMIAGLLASAWAMAAGPAVESGEYVYILGGSASGTMTVKGSSFNITTIGGNCHTCAIEGTFRGRVGVDKDESTCRIAVSGNKDALKLDSSATAEACRGFCGMRAMFDGDYRRAPAACTDRQRQARIGQAHKQYAAKDYDAARTTLRSLLSECDLFMDWIERDKARSDLAVTEYHRGDNAQCLAVLSETIAVKAQKDASLFLPPCDADNYASTSKAILYNQGLCKAPIKH
ncbi:hypothetical protein [Ralstonia sp. NFACC01]|uniref:hypothetical protein n=1 Tax=Ralstonia sp. NFACC01 TaxID=1566294 RepID=UPI0008F2DC74|nr:hypothetical protein [Ralstonia sp. NFACC01]SFP23210.1 hypothetical protein SAMN03159417_01612 [Ralstonia sp. NFACC01]